MRFPFVAITVNGNAAIFIRPGALEINYIEFLY